MLESIKPTPADAMVIVDSFGYLYREQIDSLYHKYAEAMEGTGKDIGIHAHNNLAVGLCQYDRGDHPGSQPGRCDHGRPGRGAGNCPMELLLGFLRNPKFKLRPVISVLQDYIEPLRSTVEWGPLVPYNITGQMNRHPSAAMEFRASKEKDDFVKFYDQIVNDA